MSTTDTRAAFEAHYRKECGMPDSAAFQWDAPYMVAALDGWQAALAWQAATEAAKATGTAGEVEHIHSPGEQADIGKRIRRVAKASGYVPDGTDEFYYAAAFAILGRAADALEQAARQPAPVLSDEQIDHIARSYFAEEYAQMHVKNAIHDALAGARVLRPDHRETLEQIAHFLHNSVRIQQNAPDDYYPATEFDSQLQQAADEIGSILAATNQSQP